MLDIKVEMLKERDEVIVIGGTHCGREGTLVGSIPKCITSELVLQKKLEFSRVASQAVHY
jgi:hypothetical protein